MAYSLYQFLDTNSYPNKSRQYRMLYSLPNISKPDFTFNDIAMLYRTQFGSSGGGMAIICTFRDVIALFPAIISTRTKPITYFSRKENRDINTDQKLFTINQHTLSQLLVEIDKLFTEINFRGKSVEERKEMANIAQERLKGWMAK